MKMTFDLPAIAGTYRISRPDEIETPRLLVFHDRVEENIARMRRAVAQITGSDRLDLLCPHVKTHKSPWVTHKLMQNGVSFFKATPNEIEMLARVGAPRVLVAYPPLPHLVKKLSKLAESHPHTAWVVQISQPEHVAWILENSALCWDYMIDLDIGMHRTGIAPHRALEIWQQCQRSNRLRFAGLHAYDGHIHHPDPQTRQAESARCMQNLLQTAEQFRGAGISVAELVVGGTPSALLDLQNLVDLRPQARIAISPGTWIYHDTTYDALMPGAFVPAALILARIMDRIDENHVTLNLGHKRFSVDQGAPDRISLAGGRLVRWSEEHTVVEIDKSSRVRLGDYVLIAPRHVCSTVNLWEYFVRIGAEGEIEDPCSPIEGRNR